MKINRPQVGVGVFIYSPSSSAILLGKRKGAHGAGEWGLPGGHLELNESFNDCCSREVMEETGIFICPDRIRKLGFTNDLFEEDGLHYVTLFFETRLGYLCEPKLMEPDKCSEWCWFGLSNLPEPLFPPLKNIIKRSMSIRIET